MQMLIVLALVFASFVAIFALQNAQTVVIRIFAWERETSVAVIVLATAAVGALSAVLAGLVRQIRAGIRFHQLRSELARMNRLLEEERERARALKSQLDALARAGEGAPKSAPPADVPNAQPDSASGTGGPQPAGAGPAGGSEGGEEGGGHHKAQAAPSGEPGSAGPAGSPGSEA